MAEELGKGLGAGSPPIGSLYVKQTEPRRDKDGRSITLPGIIDIFGSLSVTSQFQLSLHLSTETSTDSGLLSHLSKAGVLPNKDAIVSYDFLCSDASLPGASFDVSQEMGSRQGTIEMFPVKRIYPPLDITFYVDSEFKIIRLFEEWMNFINPLYSYDGKAVTSPVGLGNYKNRPDFFRMQYPDSYKRIISISKFERNFRKKGSDVLGNMPRVTYRLIDAFPDQLNSIPVTYQGSVITKTTVRFLYTRYVMEVNRGEDNDK